MINNKVWVLSLVVDNCDTWDYFETTTTVAVFVDMPSNVVVLDILSTHLPAFDLDRLVKLTSGKNVEFGKHGYEIKMEEVKYVR